ncbi:MAG: hypothetical protein OXU34_07185 [Gammaproteobacteria bacterium]|nr:hypothetical protein [Gammaproteobacteria bacterium]
MSDTDNNRLNAALQSGRSYRRGLVLGLTVAELFILLLFLLLLLLTALYGAALSGSSDAQEMQVASREAGRLNRLRLMLQAENLKLDRKSIALLIESRKELREQSRQQAETIEQLAAKKGIDPSCWHETDDKGKYSQVYLFDVNIYDKSMQVEDIAPPTQYHDEKAGLPLADFPFSKRISDREFLRVTKPIHRFANDRKVRPYPCVFYVRIHDLTSAEAKERYKQAEDVIGAHFYRYRSRRAAGGAP